MRKITVPGCLRHCGAVFMLAGAASASADPFYGDPWEFEVTPAIWATRTSGDLRTTERPAALFSNGFKDTRLNGGMFSVDAGTEQWGLLLDVLGVQLSDRMKQNENPRNKPNVNYNYIQLAGTLRLSRAPFTHFDLLAGVRYSTFDMDADKEHTQCARCGRTQSWTDRIAGFRAEQRVAENWWLTLYGDYGKGDSRATWQGLLGATYRIDDDMNAKFGYRVLRVDYEQAGLLYNLKTDGIYAGLGMRF